MLTNDDYAQEEGVEEHYDQEAAGYEEETRMDPMAEQLARLQEQIQGLQQSLTHKQRPQQEEPAELELSDEQYAAIAKDPKLLGQFVKAHLKKTTSKIQAEQKKAHFDRVAEERFPALKTNKELAQRVAQKMREMVEVTGEYAWDSPTLLLRATEIVAPTMGGVLEVNKRRGDVGSALDASTTSVHRSKPLKAKVADNDPRLQFAKAFGITDPKKLEAFKAQLGPYQPPQRRRGRSLMK